MTKEEKKAIDEIRNWRNYIIKNKEKVNRANDIEFYLRTVLNLIEKQQKEIAELKEKYDKDTHTLQNQLDLANADRVEKDKIIDEMAPRVYLTKEEREEMKKDIYNNVNHKGFADFVKRYFEKKVSDGDE